MRSHLNLQAVTLTVLLMLFALTSPLTAEEAVVAEVVEPATTGVVELTVTNVKSDIGNIYITVYDSKEGWLKEPVLSTEVLVAGNRVDDVVTTTLDLPAGEYAISVYHDANDNQKMETTFIGLPKEPAGLSKNQVPRFGPPKFRKSMFELTDVHQESIKLRD